MRSARKTRAACARCSPAVPPNASQEEPCAKQILTTLARRAYRRPATAQDLETLMTFYQEGRRSGTFDDGIELALRRLLASPQFLVRAEKEPPNRAGRPDLSHYRPGTGLSFVVLPVEQHSGRRTDQPGQPGKAEQSRQCSSNRCGACSPILDPTRWWKTSPQQLLYLRNLPATSPDGVFYPDWDDELRQSFRRETELLFESIMREDRNVVDLLTADYTFVNERLAKHYGIPNIYGSHFRRVTLGPELDYRRGLLGQGSFLSITWTQNFRTSPVKRGVWVLENILGTPPPEPPPNVPALEDSAGGSAKDSDLARADDAAPRQSSLCELSQDHGPDRFRARQL